jgi:hypothetical protein
MSTTTEQGTVGAGGPPAAGELDGTWKIERTGGFLPPLYGVTKRIAGATGETRAGPLPGLRFDVVGLELRYRLPLTGWVDVLEARGDGTFTGRAEFLGREVGTFSMRRVAG